MVATAPQRNAPKLSKSLFNNPLIVNARVSTAPQRIFYVKLILATIALLTGGMIYVLWRTETLMMFSWFDKLGIGSTVKMLRNYAAPYSHTLPHWFYYSLPQALWLFSGILFFNCIWHKGSIINYMFWTALFAELAFGWELGQFLKIVPGYFTIWDLLLLVAALLLALALIVLTRYPKKEVYP